MRIEVVGADTISQQARTYAEYRVFAALTQFSEADKVRRVRVLLRPVNRGRGCESIACTVTVALEGSDSFGSEQQVPTHMPRSTARSNVSEPRRRQDWSQTPSPCEACRRQRPCAIASCPVRCPVTDGVRYSTPAAD